MKKLNESKIYGGGKKNNPFNENYTLVDLVQDSCKKYANLVAFQFRNVKRKIRRKELNLRKNKEEDIILHEFDLPQQITYRNLGLMIHHLSQGILRQFGGLKQTRSRIGLFCHNRYEWFITFHSIIMQRLVAVSIYPTMREDHLAKIINELELKIIFVSTDQLGNLESIRSQVPTLEHIIYVSSSYEDDFFDRPDGSKETRFKSYISFHYLLELGRKQLGDMKIENIPIPRSKSSDLVSITYSSGSNTVPRGIQVQHSNILCGIASQIERFGVRQDDNYLAYLSVTNMTEYIFEHTGIYVGGVLSFGTIPTLADEGCVGKGDIFIFQPTIFMGIPRVYEVMRAAIIQAVSKMGFVAKNLFKWGLEKKSGRVRNQEFSRIFPYDRVVFDQVRKGLGGKLRLLGSGVADFREECWTFMMALLCPDVVICQGLGVSEGAGPICVHETKDFPVGTCGRPAMECEIKLVDVPEWGYFVKDGCGEVYVRGDMICNKLGYYNDEELTKKYYTEDGWLKTRDICRVSKNGMFSFIARKDLLIRNKNKAVISLEKLEVMYSSHKFLGPSSICIYCDESLSQCIAICSPEPKAVLKFAKKKDWKESFMELLKKKKFHKEFKKKLDEIAKVNNVRKDHYVSDIIFSGELWLRYNGYMSPTSKFRRDFIYGKFDKEIKEIKRKYGWKEISVEKKKKEEDEVEGEGEV